MTYSPTTHETGFPPKDEKNSMPFSNFSTNSWVVTTPPIGCPFPIGLPLKIKYIKIFIYIYLQVYIYYIYN